MPPKGGKDGQTAIDVRYHHELNSSRRIAHIMYMEPEILTDKETRVVWEDTKIDADEYEESKIGYEASKRELQVAKNMRSFVKLFQANEAFALSRDSADFLRGQTDNNSGEDISTEMMLSGLSNLFSDVCNELENTMDTKRSDGEKVAWLSAQLVDKDSKHAEELAILKQQIYELQKGPAELFAEKKHEAYVLELQEIHKNALEEAQNARSSEIDAAVAAQERAESALADAHAHLDRKEKELEEAVQAARDEVLFESMQSAEFDKKAVEARDIWTAFEESMKGFQPPDSIGATAAKEKVIQRLQEALRKKDESLEEVRKNLQMQAKVAETHVSLINSLQGDLRKRDKSLAKAHDMVKALSVRLTEELDTAEKNSETVTKWVESLTKLAVYDKVEMWKKHRAFAEKAQEEASAAAEELLKVTTSLLKLAVIADRAGILQADGSGSTESLYSG